MVQRPRDPAAEPAGRTRAEWNQPWRKRCLSVSESASSDVLDGDLLSVDFHDVTWVEVGRTVFDGRIAFARGTRCTADPHRLHLADGRHVRQLPLPGWQLIDRALVPSPGVA
ncbi:hypothetical protein ACFXDI_12555 [Streptomyces mirabilis]|uniref:hypothetical protein n=1 Tax=Streptomyces mirabilis TaxID=68239 RepID=UPI0036CADD85